MAEPRLVLDFEAYSEVDITKVGSAVYSEHPSTEILCLSWKFKPSGLRGLWTPGMPFPQPVIDHVNQKGLCEAHNVSTEFYMWLNKLYRAKEVWTYGRKYPLPPIPMPTRWVDTVASCAYRALPLGLDKVGLVLDLATQKDQRGKYLIQKLSKPRKPTKKDPSTRLEDYGLLEEMYAYCDRDVDSEELLGDTIGDLPKAEYMVWLLDQKINGRGVLVDEAAVRAAIHIRDHVVGNMATELVEITDGQVETGKQVAKIREWLSAHGYGLPDLKEETVSRAVKDLEKVIKLRPEKEEELGPCKRVLEIRQVLANSSSSKLDKFNITVCADGRTRGLLQYHGAGTGRWSGRLVQPQNFPRGSVKNAWYKDKKTGEMKEKLDEELLIEHIKTRNPGLLEIVYGNPLDAISTALRSMFMAAPGKTFRVADFSAIEARGTMWLAKQKDALKVFAEYDKGIGPDIYCAMAEHLYDRAISKDDDPEERQLGKVTILGCGYQMGPARLQQQAEDDYGIKLTEDQAEWLVGTYRETYDRVPALWRGLENACFGAVEDEKRYDYSYVSYEITEDAAGKWLVCILPNGRKLWYYNPKIIETLTSWGAKKWAVSYEGRDNKRGGSWQRVTTYGGMQTENVVQALSRDVMVEAMFRVEKAGYPIVMTVHDEVIAETDLSFGSTKEFEKLLKGPNPVWAAGFPMNAEGWSGQRYKKG